MLDAGAGEKVKHEFNLREHRGHRGNALRCFSLVSFWLKLSDEFLVEDDFKYMTNAV